jgi:hypothetical protein
VPSPFDRGIGIWPYPRVLPAPFPPYVLALFSAFARLPFRVATVAWLTVSIVAVGLLIVTVQRMTGLHAGYVALALLASAGYASFVNAQIVPLALMAFAFAAYAARNGRPWEAAIAAGIGAIEPNLALPVWLELFFGMPSARKPLLAVGAILLIVSLSVGIDINREYLVSVVPMHARSEVYNFGPQYGLPALLVAVGIPIRLALGAASAAWIVLVGAGTWLGIRMQDRFGDRAFLVLTPLAVSLIGAPFEHGHQLAATIPLLLMLLVRAPRRAWARVVALVAIIGFAVPWETLAESPFVTDRHAFHPVAPLRDHAHPEYNTSIEVTYTVYMDAYAQFADQRSVFEQVLWKVPTWLAMVGLLAITMESVVRETRYAVVERGRKRP